MTLTPGMLDAMIAAGLSADQIVSVTKAALAADEATAEARRAKRRAGNAERQRRFRDRRNADVTQHNAVTERDPPKENNQTPTESKSESAREPASDWPEDYRDQTWATYGQRREQKVSNKALDNLKLSGRVPWAEFIAGVRRQTEHVEQQFRPSLERFIKREKWTDEYAPCPNGGARSFRPVNGSNGHVSPHRGSVTAELRAQIERDLEYVPVDEGEGIRARSLRLVSHR